MNRFDKNTAKWLSDPIIKAITELMSFGVKIVALVADNEAVNRKLHRFLEPTLPFFSSLPVLLIPFSCASTAH